MSILVIVSLYIKIVFKSSGVHDLGCEFNELNQEAQVNLVYLCLNIFFKKSHLDFVS